MRRIAFRFVLIGILVASLMQITDENSKNYGTQISSSIGNITIDIPDVIDSASKMANKTKNEAGKLIESLLKEFGFNAEEDIEE